MRRSHISTLIALAAAFALTGAGCSLLNRAPATPAPVTLEWWRASADAGDAVALAPVIAAYRVVHPNVTVHVRSIRPDEYRDMLTTALAEDRGPDIISLPNTWIRGWKPRLAPQPETLPNRLTVRQTINDYLEVAATDILLPGDTGQQQLWGLPFSADTLVLFANADLMAKAKVAVPPATWYELREVAKGMTVTDSATGKVTQSGAALGTSQNIRYAADIMAAIMAQNGAQFDSFNADSGATFGQTQAVQGSRVQPAADALAFYRSFADPDSGYRTWDASQPDSLEAFATGRTAFYIGYPTDAAALTARAPKLNFTLNALPLIYPEKTTHLAGYPIEAVTRKSAHQAQAWDLLLFAAKAENVRAYLDATHRPTALRALIAAQSTDPAIAPFANQALTALTWYRGRDATQAEDVFLTMIEAPPKDPTRPDWQSMVSAAQNQINKNY